MPQLDTFTYFTQMIWFLIFFVFFYCAIWNNTNGIISIIRILKLRNHLLSYQSNSIKDEDRKSGEASILNKGFSTCTSFLCSSLLQASEWCESTVLFKKRQCKRNRLLFGCGELKVYRKIESEFFSRFSCSISTTGRKEGMLLQALLSQNNL
uniref:H(+)-transporting two-sector ATPase n=1 Tax=Pelargonium citronellum TaxID=73188 RepID=A0A1J0PJU5_9ROSI|nr:ATP synthase subunit 8 [Pelargonium citronellum]